MISQNPKRTTTGGWVAWLVQAVGAEPLQSRSRLKVQRIEARDKGIKRGPQKMVQNAETAESTASANVLIEEVRGHPSECHEDPHPSVNGGEGFAIRTTQRCLLGEVSRALQCNDYYIVHVTSVWIPVTVGGSCGQMRRNARQICSKPMSQPASNSIDTNCIKGYPTLIPSFS